MTTETQSRSGHPAGPAPGPLYADLRHQLAALRRQGRLDEAAERLTAAIEADDAAFWPLNELLWLLQQRRDWPSARYYAALARERFPDQSVGYLIGCTALRQAKDYDAVETVVAAAAARFDGETWLAAEKVALAEGQGRIGDALALARLLFERDRGEASWRTCVRLLRRSGLADEALRLLETASGRFPDNRWVSLDRAQVLADRGDWGDALAHAHAARLSQPGNALACIIEIRALRQLGRIAEADSRIAACDESFPGQPWVIVEAARLASAQRDWEKAARHWERFRADYPRDAQGYVEGAGAYQACGRAEDADRTIRAALQRFPRDPALWQRYAALAENRLDWREADHRWSEAVWRLPEHRQVRLSHALLWIRPPLDQHRKVPTALARLASLVADAPDFMQARLALSDALRQTNAFDRAEDAARTACQLFPTSPEPALALAKVLHATARIAEAVRTIDDAARRHPENVGVAALQVTIRAEAGDHDGAEAAAAQRSALFADNVELHVALAKAAERRDDLSLATERWRHAATLFPDNRVCRQHLADCVLALQAAAPAGTGHADAELLVDARPNGRTGADTDLAWQFESLGGSGQGCEFGIVQRLLGAEPLGLLRWANMQPDQLVDALDNRFEGVGTPQQTVLETFKTGQYPEYRASDRRYGMAMHTFISVRDADHDKAHAQVSRRLSFLTRKMLETLDTHDKVFVYKIGERRLPLEQVQRVSRALRQFGDNWLLYVYLADAEHPPGHTTLVGEGLVLGYIDRFSVSPTGEPQRPNVTCWTTLCRKLLELRAQHRTPVGKPAVAAYAVTQADDADLPAASGFEDAVYAETVGTPVKIQRADDPAAAELLARFESCGENCEFGMLQRRYGVEPISLFRWANIRPDILSRMLEERLADFARPDNVSCVTAPWGEVLTKDRSYHFTMHTFVHGESLDLAQFRNREIRRLGFMKRVFLERLAERSKIFVYKSRLGLPGDVVRRLADAFRSHGDNRLLIVQPPDTQETGTVTSYSAGVALGFVAGLGPATGERRKWHIPFETWLRTCRVAAEMLDS